MDDIIPSPLFSDPVVPVAVAVVVALEAIVVAHHRETDSEVAVVGVETTTSDGEVLLRLIESENVIVIGTVIVRERGIVKENEKTVVDMIVMLHHPRIIAIEGMALPHHQEDVMMTSEEKQALLEVEECNI